VSDIGPDEPSTTNARDVRVEQVRWLWRNRIPLGKLTLLGGDPDKGKSLFTMELVRRSTTNGLMPDGSYSDRAWSKGVLVVSGEDAKEDTMVPRLMAAGADLTLVEFLNGVEFTNRKGGRALRPLSLPDDIEQLDKAMRKHLAGLVILDPLDAFLGEAVNTISNHHIRRALLPLAELAERSGAAILAVGHLNKTSGPAAMYRSAGSIGIIAMARSALLIAPDPEDEERRVLAVVKSNLARRPPALAFRIVAEDDNPPRIMWLGEARYHADDLVASRRDVQEAPAVRDAMGFLVDLLSKRGDMWVKDVFDEADKAGVGGKTTLKKAKAALTVRSVPCTEGKDKGWKWHLPKDKFPGQTQQEPHSNGKSPGQGHQEPQLPLDGPAG
jgi:hypothetical protein